MPVPSATPAWTAVSLAVAGTVIGFVRNIRPLVIGSVAIRPVGLGLVLGLAG